MLSKELGKTGVGVPEIGFGTWNYKGGAEPLRAVYNVQLSESPNSLPPVEPPQRRAARADVVIPLPATDGVRLARNGNTLG